MEEEDNPTNWALIEKVYAFFEQAEKTGRRFTRQDIVTEVGYTSRTARSYITKKWHWFLIREKDETYFCRGLHRYSKTFFTFIHLQKVDLVLLEQFIAEKTSKASPISQSLQVQSENNSRILLVVLLLYIIWWLQFTRRVYVSIGWLRIPL